MNEIKKHTESFVGYEYKDVTASSDMEGVYADGYPSFGWVLDGTASSIFGGSDVNLRFKRDRKIRNKAELTRLQRQFESNVDEIKKLENSKVTSASIAAFSIGIAGTAFMAGSVFAFLGDLLPLCIILAVPAFIGWVLPYFSFMRLKAKRTEKVTPLIEQQYDAIYEVCQKAHGLLA